MAERKEIDAGATALMVVLCAIWGMQQVAIKAAAPLMAPVLQVAIRSGVAAVVIAGLVLVRGEAGALRSDTWRAGIIVGLLFAMEFLFVGEGLRFTSASHMAIFLYTAPIFAALGLHLRLPEERMTALQWCGTGVAFAGIVVSFAGRGAANAGSTVWIGDLLGIAAGASWGATTLAVRFSILSDTPATVTLLYQLLGAFVLLTISALFLGQTGVTVAPLLGVSLAFQIVLVSLVSFLAWFSLLRIYLASRLGVLAFMTPLFGVSFGVLILGERLDPSFVIGALFVLGGILLVAGRDLFGRRRLAR
ncbi:DMT family transporter [Sphingomonas nostoxanthinifaciens]|uniref:DMT family transporter n=1 Tax=Sphingomonas nostoxanthinifaciens TaxID=2872652 RepID=UPI001CC2085A|nr:DMT family transporter [Sphingomonas nostoxanthinifaciens]UAK24112.1 DMT family transporter [Sphingomonas nostoxanthinifaciens]